MPMYNFRLMTPNISPAIERAMNALKFVAQHVRNEDNFDGVSTIISLFFQIHDILKLPFRILIPNNCQLVFDWIF